jgi:signal transduction histidine kinase
MQRSFLLHLFLLLQVSFAFAQDDLSCHVQQYSTENGLPSNGIKGFQFDEHTGFLWIATEAGIVRFNGVDFVTYTSENTPSIASERMLFTTRNNKNQILVSDALGNIFTINKSNPVLWIKSPGVVNAYYDDYFLFSVSDLFFKKQFPNRKLNNLSSVVSRVASISDTSCLILSNGSLFYFSIGMNKPDTLLFEKNRFHTIFKIGSAFFLTGKEGKFYRLDAHSFQLSELRMAIRSGANRSMGIDARWFWETGMKHPIVIDGGNAYLVDYAEENLVAKPLFSGIPNDAFIRFVLYSEKNNQLFLGSDSRGIIVISPNRVTPKKRPSVLANRRNAYYAQIDLGNGNVLTNEGDIIGDNPSKKDLPVNGPFNVGTSITSDSVLWYGAPNPPSADCLHSYHYKTKQTKTYSWLSPATLITEQAGKTWFVNNEGIGLMESDSSRLIYKYPDTNFGNGLFDFKPLENDQLLIASCSGLLRFNVSNKKMDTVLHKNGVCIRSIWNYKGYYFIGSYGAGFFIYKNGKLKAMPLDKNNFLRYAHCFVPDENGFCWISTNRGLFKASISDLVNAYEKEEPHVYYHYLGKNDGMNITEMNGGCTPCALRLKNNILSFPTMDGLLWVNPSEAKILLPEGNIYIDEFRAGKIIIDPDSLVDLNLKPLQRDISIKLGYSSWSNKENIYLDYQLNDNDWPQVDIEKGAIISFNNLSPGNYYLKIRKLNGFGVNNYSYKELDFTISKPWSQQWWFYLLVITAVWALVSVYLKWRTRQYQVSQRKLERQVADKTRELKDQNEVLEKNNTIKSRLISIISHDIITPLKFLTVAGNNLIEKRKMMKEELQQETIREMTNTSRELQLLTTNILNWIKYQNENRLMARETFSVNEMVAQVLGLLQSLAKQKTLLLENKVPENLTVFTYYEPLKIIIYNLLTNAIQFTEKGRITIEANGDDHSLTLNVTDDGVGMTPEQIQRILAEQVVITSANVDNKKGHGLGYLIIKDLVKSMNATLEIESFADEGTRVTIKIMVNV